MPAVTVNDRTLHYRDGGTGDTPVVLLHGFPLDSGMWEPQFEALGRNSRVIAPDLAGAGASDPPEDPAAWSVEACADDVIALLGALGLDHVTLVGASLGADVALAVARRERDVVGALALAGLRAGPASPDDGVRFAEQARWVEGGGELGSVIDRLVDDLVGRGSPRRAEVVQVARLMMERTPRAGWLAGFAALGNRPPVAADADKLDVPVILLTGDEDLVAPAGDARALAAAIPGAGFVEVPESGHLPNLENAAVFNRAVEDVLAGRSARRPSGKHGWPAAPATTR